ncbi:hypothetical protein F4604DRAFT_1921913 [Suillus subluteus]|nr:hypothetical protein F4604DRAFT_1921913 [Suillus subluteus]
MATGVPGCAAGGRLALAQGTGPAIGDATNESTSITSKLLTIYKTLVLPEIACCPYRFVSTWVEECMEEYYMDNRATEGASLQILISQASDISDSEAEMCFLEAELSLMQSRHWRAQMEVELLSDAIQYLIESGTICSMSGATPHHRSFVDQYEHLLDSSSNTDTRLASPALNLAARDDASCRVDTISTSSLNDEVTAPASLNTGGEEDLPLAQRRTRRNDVQLPRHYRQFDDILPQPLPSIPANYVNHSSNSPPPVLCIQSSEALPPFRTPCNIFGLLRQFFSPNPPSHDPEEVVILEDISAIPGSKRERPLSNGETSLDNSLDKASPYYPYSN